MLLTAGSAMTVSSCYLLLAAIRAVFSSSAGGAVRAAGVSLDLAALGVALASVTSKELLFHVTHIVGKRTNSPSLVANACETPTPVPNPRGHAAARRCPPCHATAAGRAARDLQPFAPVTPPPPPVAQTTTDRTRSPRSLP